MPQANRKKSGFTLIESLVAVGLFGLVISLAVGGFVKALRTQSQITALLSANGNASLAMEQIAREVRTGYNFVKCSAPNPQFGFCTELSFTNAEGHGVIYSLAEDASGRGSITKSDSGAAPINVTADNVDVKYLSFYLEGEKKGDGEPPRITVSVGVSPSGNAADVSITRIQTSVSARQSD